MSSEALLVIRGLRKSFGGLPALGGVNLTVPRGQILGLMGPNGSGKTTLLNVVTGIYRPDGGEVILNGTPITGLPSHRLVARGLNRTFQLPRPFPSLTVRQNIEVAARHARPGQVREIDEILDFVGLRSLDDREAASLNAIQQKELDLGRALATGPDLLFVDELGAGLGPRDLDAVSSQIHALANQGLTLVVVEHVMTFLATLTNQVVVMNAGREIFSGDLESASRDPQVVEVFLGGKA